MEMDTMWDKIKKGLKDGATMSMDKIEEYTKIGKLKIEEMAAHRKVDRNFLDIGERVVDLLDEGKAADISADLTVKKAADNIKALRVELVTIADKIRKVSEEARQKSQAKSSPAKDEEITGI